MFDLEEDEELEAPAPEVKLDGYYDRTTTSLRAMTAQLRLQPPADPLDLALGKLEGLGEARRVRQAPGEPVVAEMSGMRLSDVADKIARKGAEWFERLRGPREEDACLYLSTRLHARSGVDTWSDSRGRR